MILKTEIDLNDLEGWDGQSIASTIAYAIQDELKRQVKRELKKDPQVTELVNKLKSAAIKTMLDSFDD
jgi:hypothetical protein